MSGKNPSSTTQDVIHPCRWQGADLLLAIRVQPRASQVRVLGIHNAAIKIALTAPPVEGAANQALCRWLAKELGVAKCQVNIVTGEHSRNKQIRIKAVDKTSARTFCQRWQLPEPT